MSRFITCFVILMCLVPSRIDAQQVQPGPTGTHALRALLNEREIQPLNRVSDIARPGADPRRTLIIVLGDPSWLDRNLYPGFDSAKWVDFLAKGGAMLIATDLASTSPNPWSTEFGFEITGELIRATHPDDQYAGHENCPLVVPTPAGQGKGLFEVPRRVATNNPSRIRIRNSSRFRTPFGMWNYQSELTGLGAYSPRCRTESGDRIVPLRDWFAVGGKAFTNGRLLVLADHSVFINHMMLRPDTGNLEFAERCLDYLQEGRQRRRDRCLFIEDGEVVSDFKLRLAELPTGPPLPPLPVLVNATAAAGNRAIAELQDRDHFNRLLVGDESRFPTSRLIRNVLGGLTISLVLFGFVRLWRGGSRARPDPLMKTVNRPVKVGGPDSLAQRREEQSAPANQREIARNVVRDWFREHGAETGSKPIIHGSFWQRRQINRELEALMAFASEEQHEAERPMRTREWHKLRARMVELNRLAHKGIWQYPEASTR